jgi:hypothetical protein
VSTVAFVAKRSQLFPSRWAPAVSHIDWQNGSGQQCPTGASSAAQEPRGHPESGYVESLAEAGLFGRSSHR